MKHLLLTFALVLCASPALAQVPAIGSESLGWDQAAPTAAVAQSYAYDAIDGTAAPVALNGVTCSGTASPFLCRVRLPALTTGLHNVAVVAKITVNGQTLASQPSVPLSLLIVAVPAIPQNPRLVP